jgi:hypothetical protein
MHDEMFKPLSFMCICVQLRPFLDDIQSALNIIVDIDVVRVSEPPFFPRFSFMDFPSVGSSGFKLLMKYLPSGEGLMLCG